jgi:hypothetical protein
LSSYEIESGNNRFVVENEFLIHILSHKLTGDFSKSSNITIPSFIAVLGPACFESYESLSSISFESPSRLTRVESHAFANSYVRVLLPSTLVFLAHNAQSNLSKLSLADPDLCSVLDRWQRVRESRVAVDFRPILKPRSDHPCLKDSVFDITDWKKSQSFLRRIEVRADSIGCGEKDR